jgi:hypothetical protein
MRFGIFKGILEENLNELDFKPSVYLWNETKSPWPNEYYKTKSL